MFFIQPLTPDLFGVEKSFHFFKGNHMFGLDAVEIGVLIVFAAIVILFAVNMRKVKDSGSKDEQK